MQVIDKCVKCLAQDELMVDLLCNHNLCVPCASAMVAKTNMSNNLVLTCSICFQSTHLDHHQLTTIEAYILTNSQKFTDENQITEGNIYENFESSSIKNIEALNKLFADEFKKKKDNYSDCSNENFNICDRNIDINVDSDKIQDNYNTLTNTCAEIMKKIDENLQTFNKMRETFQNCYYYLKNIGNLSTKDSQSNDHLEELETLKKELGAILKIQILFQDEKVIYKMAQQIHGGFQKIESQPKKDNFFMGESSKTLKDIESPKVDKFRASENTYLSFGGNGNQENTFRNPDVSNSNGNCSLPLNNLDASINQSPSLNEQSQKNSIQDQLLKLNQLRQQLKESSADRQNKLPGTNTKECDSKQHLKQFPQTYQQISNSLTTKFEENLKKPIIHSADKNINKNKNDFFDSKCKTKQDSASKSNNICSSLSSSYQRKNMFMNQLNSTNRTHSRDIKKNSVNVSLSSTKKVSTRKTPFQNDFYKNFDQFKEIDGGWESLKYQNTTFDNVKIKPIKLLF